MPEPNANTAEAESVRYCNVKKVVNVVRAKRANAKLGGQFFRFIGFFVLYVILVWGQRNGYNAYSITSAMREYLAEQPFRDPSSLELKSWFDTVTVDDFWNWMQLFLIPQLYPAEAENTAPGAPPMRAEDNYVSLMHNKLTGSIRLTQRRSKETSCPVAARYKPFAHQCYRELYANGYVGIRSREDFLGLDGTVYKYEELPLSGLLIDDFGYFETLPRTRTEAVAAVKKLKQNEWIGKATKWVRVDFAFYNSNVDMFTHVEHRVTYSNSGFLEIEWSAANLEPSQYSTLSARIRMAGEILLVVWWLLYVIDETRLAIREAHQKHVVFAYFKRFRNWVVFIQLNLFLALFVLWILITQADLWDQLRVEPDLIGRKDGDKMDFVSLALLQKYHFRVSAIVLTDTIGWRWSGEQEAYFVANGVNVLLCVFRMIAFMRVNASLAQLTDTFMYMKTQLFQFFVIFMVVLLTFVLMAHVMFGSKLSSYATFPEGIQTGFEVLQGANEYFDLLEADSVAAPIFFYPYIFIMIFVVLNMTVAIIMDAYLAMQDQRKEDEKSELEDLVRIQPITQMYRGFIRQLAPCAAFLPQAWASRLNGMDKDMVLELFSDYVDGTELALDMTCVEFDKVRDLLRDREITEEMLVNVFDRYKAWATKTEHYDHVVARLVEAHDEEQEWHDMVESLTKTMDDVKTQQEKMESKLQLLIKHFDNF